MARHSSVLAAATAASIVQVAPSIAVGSGVIAFYVRVWALHLRAHMGGVNAGNVDRSRNHVLYAQIPGVDVLACAGNGGRSRSPRVGPYEKLVAGDWQTDRRSHIPGVGLWADGAVVVND